MRSVLPLLFVALLLPPGRASADVSSGELIEQGAAYDGKTVDFSGEAIGESMQRGDHAWVNVSDGQNALGVWIRAEVLSSIHAYGTYATRGDVLRIRGTFHRACAEHGGDMDLHAETVAVVTHGAPTPHELSGVRVVAAGILLVASLVAFLLWRRREKVVHGGGPRPAP